MATYTFSPKVVLDVLGEAAPGAQGTIHAVGDTAGATPLPVTDLNGVVLTYVTANALGMLEAFRVENHAEVVWRSGPYAVHVVSPEGYRAAAVAAAADAAEALLEAQAAAQAAQAAAGLVNTPTDTAMTNLVNNAASQFRAAVVNLITATAPGGGGGTGDVTGPVVRPCRYVSGAWEWATWTEAEAAGVRAQDVVLFVGGMDGTLPGWERDWDVHTAKGLA